MNIDPNRYSLKPIVKARTVSLLFLAAAIAGTGIAQTKWEYYNNVLAPQRGLKPLPKATASADRKRSVLNVGNVWARISNAAVLGYDR